MKPPAGEGEGADTAEEDPGRIRDEARPEGSELVRLQSLYFYGSTRRRQAATAGQRHAVWGRRVPNGTGHRAFPARSPEEMMNRVCATAVAVLLIGSPVAAIAQIPEEFENLKVLPDSISRDSLIALMRSFSFATGLRCEGCHVMGEGGSFRGARFDKDDKLEKRRARFMLEMVNRLNSEVLPKLPGRDTPALRVECKTCHRGLRKPYLLRTELRAIIDTAGVDSAIARYRELRENAMEGGAYDFGVWEMNELARELAEAGRDADAAAVLELNEEFHPRDPSIPRELGGVYERLDRPDAAVAAYRRALGLNPDDRQSLGRLLELTGGGG